MTNIIGCSFDAPTVQIGTLLGVLSFRAKSSGDDVIYESRDIASIEVIDEDQYRSGGKAALGAVVGGVLTGGIGFLAGAAFGGRRRHTGTYLVVFKDGQHVAFSEDRKKTIQALNEVAAKLRIEALKK
ncbi:hypothetical protein ACFQFQ_14560 [Sulfitobacter porphyrae]|uniref:Uncharacterized protein n=1 Tax=Sulfitobacter porphyrae TaxID=1246864 RepID=A0ABW2B3Z1_9RHOB|nr:hypothetical protein GCM10007928_02130 [Sulfitobacter porphyrae]